MKVIVKTKQFGEYVAQCSVALSSRRILPIYNNILLNAGDKPQIISFDGRVGMRLSIEDAITVEEGGSCLLQGEKLWQILRLDTSETMSITTSTSDRITINGDKSTYKMGSVDPVDYPAINFDVADAIALNTTDFRNAIKLLLPLVCSDSDKVMMHGILLDIVSDDCWFLVAGNGKRIAVLRFMGDVVKEALPHWILSKDYKTYRFLIPTDLVKCVLQMNDDPVIKIGFTQDSDKARQIVFKCGIAESKGISIDGEFPDWNTVFHLYSEKLDSYVVVNRNGFELSLKKTMIGLDGLAKKDTDVFLSTIDEGLNVTNAVADFAYSETLSYIEQQRHGNMEKFCCDPDFARYATDGLSCDNLKISYTDKDRDVIFIEDVDRGFRELIMGKRK
jgi:DNA polymerase III sliding clamp (beta) subunit (PCNA family)